MRYQILTVVAASLMVSTAFAKDADKDFKKDHPRRAEVNSRVRKQDKRINQGLKNGTLTPAQAQQLKGEEAGVKAQERAEVKANGGHLTKGEQKQLNQELNHDSKQIYNEKHADGTPPPSPPPAPTSGSAPAPASGN